MALPALSKTWQYSVNNQTTAQGSALASNRRTMRGIKNALIGFATNRWTVRQSSDSTAVGSTGDGVDRWAADSNLVWATAGNAHSWIVLRQTGIVSTFEMCIDLSSASSQTITVAFSAAGFSGGSTTARPTASDEVTTGAITWSNSADSSHRFHVWQSTDGECTRVCIGWGGSHGFALIVDKPNNPTTGWSNPYVVFFGVSASSLTNALGNIGRMRSGSTNGNVSLTVESLNSVGLFSDTVIGNIANEIDASWDMWPLGFACITSGIRGRHGSMFDLWFVSSTRASADMIPGDGSNQFAVLMPFIMPWNGTAAPAFS